MDNENFHVPEDGSDLAHPEDSKLSPAELPLTTPKKIIASHDISSVIGGFLKKSKSPKRDKSGTSIIWVEKIKNIIKKYINMPHQEEEEYKRISAEYQEQEQKH